MVQLTRLEVVDFRNHPAAALDLGPGVTALLGPNGAGKTGLLEAIGFLATLGSHRGGPDTALVRAGQPAAIVRARLDREGRIVLVEAEIRAASGIRGRVNKVPVRRPRELLGFVRAVLFAPEDLALVRGDPQERRAALDELAVQRRPGYLAVRQDYDRVLRQRNALLKSAHGQPPGGRGLATLDVWDVKLAAAGALVWAARAGLVADLEPRVQAAYRDLAGRADPVTLRYVASADPELGPGPAVPDRGAAGSTAAAQLGLVPVPEAPLGAEPLIAALTAALRTQRARELERGVTLVGPHRDDLLIELRELPARSHASHGEAWSLALALRVAAHQLLREQGDEPVLLLDDAFAELDAARRSSLASVARGAGQAIVTGAVPADLPAELGAARLQVAPGAVRAA